VWCKEEEPLKEAAAIVSDKMENLQEAFKAFSDILGINVALSCLMNSRRANTEFKP